MSEGRLEELWKLVREIPVGKVLSYGAVGKMLTRPVSGLIVGRWMASAPIDVPWQRVVGADGSIKTFSRGPEIGLLQKELLENEGIQFDGEDKVLASFFWDRG